MIPFGSESETDGGAERREPSATDLGKRVICQVNSSGKRKEKSGTLRYYGKPEFATGVWCGVELDDQDGRNNGSVQGIRYFSCLPNHGIFVQLNRVELEPLNLRLKGRMRPGSLERKYTAINSGMSRSSSVSALNNKVAPSGYGDYPKKYSTPGLHVSPGHVKPGDRQAAKSSITRKYLGSIQPSNSLKKYSSDMNIHLSIPSSSPVRKLPNTQRRRQCLGSCSEPPKESTQIRSYRSIQDLNLQRKTSPGESSLVSSFASTPCDDRYDSTSDFSYRCSSANSSGSDRTARSSSCSPCIDDDGQSNTASKCNTLKSLSPDALDDAFLASPTEVKEPQAKTRLVPLPKGLATPVSTFLESASKDGPNSGDCRVPSPEHNGSTAMRHHHKSRYAASGTTTTHPLLNGHAATLTDGSDTATTDGEDGRSKKTSRRRSRSRHSMASVFICPNSGQEISLENGITADKGDGVTLAALQTQLMYYSKQQALFEQRLSKMEESIEQMKAVFEKTLRETQAAHIQQIEKIHLRYANELNLLQKPNIRWTELNSNR